MTDKDTSVKIIEAAIACINEYGIEKTTIRKISNSAGVNSAAISYYFRSKDKVIELALDTTLENALHWDNFSNIINLPVRDRIKKIFLYLAEGELKYKGISRAHYYETFMHENYDTPAVRKLNKSLGLIYDNIKDELPHLNEQEIKISLTQIAYSTLVSSSFMPGFFSDFNGLNLNDKKQRELYVAGLVDKLLK